MLTAHVCKIGPSTYYDACTRQRRPSKRQIHDEEIKVEIARVHRENYSIDGARKVWLQRYREGVAVARCTVERLMSGLGLEGARRDKSNRTTIADPQAGRPDDLVQRQFSPEAPNALWVASFTYVSTWPGRVQVAFVVDAYARWIVGWRTATTMTSQLVLTAIEHAIWTRRREDRRSARADSSP